MRDIETMWQRAVEAAALLERHVSASVQIGVSLTRGEVMALAALAGVPVVEHEFEDTFAAGSRHRLWAMEAERGGVRIRAQGSVKVAESVATEVARADG